MLGKYKGDMANWLQTIFYLTKLQTIWIYVKINKFKKFIITFYLFIFLGKTKRVKTIFS